MTYSKEMLAKYPEEVKATIAKAKRIEDTVITASKDLLEKIKKAYSDKHVYYKEFNTNVGYGVSAVYYTEIKVFNIYNGEISTYVSKSIEVSFDDNKIKYEVWDNDEYDPWYSEMTKKTFDENEALTELDRLLNE